MSDYDEPIIDDVEQPFDKSATEDAIEETDVSESAEIGDGAPETEGDAEAFVDEATEGTSSSSSGAEATDDGSDDEEPEVSYEEVPLEGVEVPEELSLSDDEALAYKLLKRAAAIKGVAIDRDIAGLDEFLDSCATVARILVQNFNIEARKVSFFGIFCGIKRNIAINHTGQFWFTELLCHAYILTDYGQIDNRCALCFNIRNTCTFTVGITFR